MGRILPKSEWFKDENRANFNQELSATLSSRQQTGGYHRDLSLSCSTEEQKRRNFLVFHSYPTKNCGFISKLLPAVTNCPLEKPLGQFCGTQKPVCPFPRDKTAVWVVWWVCPRVKGKIWKLRWCGHPYLCVRTSLGAYTKALSCCVSKLHQAALGLVCYCASSWWRWQVISSALTTFPSAYPHSKLLAGFPDMKMERINTIQIYFKYFKITSPEGKCRFLKLTSVKLWRF